MQFSSDPVLIRSLNGHKESITSVDFHSGCRFAASGATDGKIFIWDLYRLGGCRSLEGHKVRNSTHSRKFKTSSSRQPATCWCPPPKTGR